MPMMNLPTAAMPFAGTTAPEKVAEMFDNTSETGGQLAPGLRWRVTRGRCISGAFSDRAQ